MSTDLAVLDPNGRQAVAVEVKARPGASREWAVRYRRNLAAHGQVPLVDFLVIVTPGTSYLWRANTLLEETEAPPDLSFDTEAVLRPYLTRLDLQLSDLSEEALELVVAEWLGDLTRTGPIGGGNVSPDESTWLDLMGKLRNGRVAFSPA